MSEKVVKFPWQDKKRNAIGEGYVSCEVSSRWLNFTSSTEYNNEDTYYHVDIMTTNYEGIDRKLTEVVISENDLLRAMQYAKNKK